MAALRLPSCGRARRHEPARLALARPAAGGPRAVLCGLLPGAVGGGGHLRLWLDVDPPDQRLRAVHRFGGAGAERDRADPDDAAQAGIVVGVAAGEHRGGAAVLQPWPALDLDPVCRLLDQRAGGAAPLAQPDARRSTLSNKKPRFRGVFRLPHQPGDQSPRVSSEALPPAAVVFTVTVFSVAKRSR
ncbi:hypothetical protein G6F57_018895 [Rhizopus arrhizus]|nr:hypothetical protein G6F57_018895 [Rhizopus arrhizus]